MHNFIWNMTHLWEKKNNFYNLTASFQVYVSKYTTFSHILTEGFCMSKCSFRSFIVLVYTMLTWWIFLNKVVFNHIWVVVAGRYRRLTHCTEDSGWAVHVQIQALYELKWFHVLLLPLLITDWTDQMSLIRSNIFLTMFPNSIFHLKAEQMSLFFF